MTFLGRLRTFWPCTRGWCWRFWFHGSGSAWRNRPSQSITISNIAEICKLCCIPNRVVVSPPPDHPYCLPALSEEEVSAKKERPRFCSLEPSGNPETLTKNSKPYPSALLCGAGGDPGSEPRSQHSMFWTFPGRLECTVYRCNLHYTYIYIYIYACLCVHILWVYIYIYIHMHTHTHIIHIDPNLNVHLSK